MMTLPIIKVRDKHSGLEHVVGTDTHDVLLVNEDGSISYMNLQNGEGSGPDSVYEFVTEFDGCWTTIPWSEDGECSFQRGDIVRHRKHPEWGNGVIIDFSASNKSAYLYWDHGVAAKKWHGTVLVERLQKAGDK
ncbi:hypothetical protein [Alicyclobacillus fastidiosus]|uniref:YopX protein domain-containing protein n=1 Tax=Alicyclobacillus fastidiosus TaxID=392011 RepID=A0ABV5ALX8_9BACL|nr:hypothetical protein [Alicyclobacillus fastidiosus]WEH09290.1 hypothetical protein PYS47_21880 [Alicyclobacillus fastidiosus]